MKFTNEFVVAFLAFGPALLHAMPLEGSASLVKRVGVPPGEAPSDSLSRLGSPQPQKGPKQSFKPDPNGKPPKTDGAGTGGANPGLNTPSGLQGFIEGVQKKPGFENIGKEGQQGAGGNKPKPASPPQQRPPPQQQQPPAQQRPPPQQQQPNGGRQPKQTGQTARPKPPTTSEGEDGLQLGQGPPEGSPLNGNFGQKKPKNPATAASNAPRPGQGGLQLGQGPPAGSPLNGNFGDRII